MKNKMLGELVLLLALIVLLLLFLNPLTLMLPRPMHPFMVPLLVIFLIIFAAFFWQEQPGDERAQLHKFISSRLAYFAAVAGMTVAIVVQHQTGVIDPWLIIILCITLLAKIVGTLYGHWKM